MSAAPEWRICFVLCLYDFETDAERIRDTFAGGAEDGGVEGGANTGKGEDGTNIDSTKPD